MSVLFKSMSLCSDDITQDLFGIRKPRLIFKSMSICGAKYRILTVVDTDGNAIVGAAVSISDAGDYSKSGTTESDGSYSSILNGENITNPVTVVISKTGYLTRTRILNVTERPNWDIVLPRLDEVTSPEYHYGGILQHDITAELLQHDFIEPILQHDTCPILQHDFLEDEL